MKTSERFLAFLLSIILILQSFVIYTYAEEEELAGETYETVDESDGGGSDETCADEDEMSETDLTEEGEEEASDDFEEAETLSEPEETAEASEEQEEESTNIETTKSETEIERESLSGDVIKIIDNEPVFEETTEDETSASAEEDSATPETEISGEAESGSAASGGSGGSGSGSLTITTGTVSNILLGSSGTVYTVTVNADGGTLSNTGWTDNGDGTYSINIDSSTGSITLPSADQLTKMDYALAGWTTSEGGTSVVYASGAEIAFEDLSGNITLWAVWRVGYTVTLALNSGKLKSDNWTANTDGTYSTVLYGGTNQYLTHSITLPTSSELTLSGYKLMGWCKTNSSDTADYLPGDTISYDDLTGSLNLWAVWEIESYSVTFKTAADGDTLWQTDIEYGTALWNDASVSPWDDDGVAWTYYDENGDEIASVTTDSDGNLVDENTGKYPAYGIANVKIYDSDTDETEITKVFDVQTDGGDTTVFVYYTFTYENEKWFTAAEGIVPDKSGYTFRDWYMIYSVLGDTIVESDNTVFIARYMDTGGYIAAVNYRYSSKTIAASSENLVLNYDSSVTGNYVYAKITANVIDGYVPTLISSSDDGVYLGEYDANLEVTEYSYNDIVNTEGTEVISLTDGNTYVYYIRIDVTSATFTGTDGETVAGTDNASIHYVTFTVVYDPNPAGYRVNYFRELDLATYNERANASITSGHTNTYELFESDEVTVAYDSSAGAYVWTHTWYTVYTEETWAKVLEDNGYSASDYPLSVELGKTAVTTTNNEGESVVYYYYVNNSTIADTLGLTAYYHDVQSDSVEYRTGDTLYPVDITENSNSYDGYVLGTGSQSLISTGYDLVTAYSSNIRGIFYNRADYHVYYITNSDSATVENKLYVYGDEVEYPSESDAVRQGYTLDTSAGDKGWIYYTDIPSLYDDPDEVLYNGENGLGYKPDTMPSCDLYAVAQWKVAQVSVTMNLYREAANYVDHVNEYQVDIGPDSSFVKDSTDEYIKFDSSGDVTDSTTYAFSAEDIFFSTGDIITVSDVSSGIEDYYEGNIDTYDDYNDKTSDECKSYMLGYLTAYLYDLYVGDMEYFTYSKSYTTSSAVNASTIEVEYDNGTDVRVLYERNWYVLEMFLGRRSGTTTLTYQVPNAVGGTGGTFAGATWVKAASATVGTYDADTLDKTYLPQVAENSDNVVTYSGTNSDGDSFTYFKYSPDNYPDLWSKQTMYADGSSRYLGPYGLFTDDYQVTSGGTTYTCSVYYIYAKWGAEIGELWPTLNNSVYITSPAASSYTNYQYVSMGSNTYSHYRDAGLPGASNPCILNVYSSMSSDILLMGNSYTAYAGSDGIITLSGTLKAAAGSTTLTASDAGFDPGMNSDGKVSGDKNAVIHAANVNHRMISYWWYTVYTYYYYFLVEALDGSLDDDDVDYELTSSYIGDNGSTTNNIYNTAYAGLNNIKEGEVVRVNYGNGVYKYYIAETCGLAQNSSNWVYGQTQPSISGCESIGRAYYSTNQGNKNNGGNNFFFYDRERFDVTLSNRGGTNSEYMPPVDILTQTIHLSDGSTTTLAAEGFEIRKDDNGAQQTGTISYTLDNGSTYSYTYCQLQVKYGTNSEALAYLCSSLYGNTGYPMSLVNYDGDLYDNYVALSYTLMTKGTGTWTFDRWYRDSAHTTNAWDDGDTDATYTQYAYCDYTLYAGWIPPEYPFNFHLGRGSYALYGIDDSSSDIYKMIWIFAVSPNADTADVLQSFGYTEYVSEGDYMDRPIEPILYGYEFNGWYYFNENTGTVKKVYLSSITDPNMEIDIYEAGYTYTDGYGVVRYLMDDNDGKGLYYDDNVRGMRYIFGETSPIFGETNVYASYVNADAEEYIVWHVVKVSDVDSELGIDTSQYQTITLDVDGVETEYYLIAEDDYTNQKDNETYTAYSKTNLTTQGSEGTCYFIPAVLSRSVTIDRSLYPTAAENSGTYTYDYDNLGYDGDGYIFSTTTPVNTTYSSTVDGVTYTATTQEEKYTFYVIHEYSVTTNLSYTVRYVDLSKLYALYPVVDYPDYYDENGYLTRYVDLSDEDTKSLSVSSEKTGKLTDLTDITNLSVTESARNVEGYNLLGSWQEQLTLLAGAEENNIYFYYQSADYDAYYLLTYYIMNDENTYDGSKKVEIKYMPGVHSFAAYAETLAEEWYNYIYNAAANYNTNYPPIITVTDTDYDTNVTTTTIYKVYGGEVYIVADEDDDPTLYGTLVTKADFMAVLEELFEGTVYDSGTSGSSYVVIDKNDPERFLNVYMRYGSVKIIKYDEAGNTLSGAGFNLVQYDENGDPTGNTYDVTTGADGTITLYDLPLDENYYYILTETTPPGEGYQLLKESVTLYVPYVSTDPLNGEYDYSETINGVTYYYWYDVTCEVTDSAKFDIPTTGGGTLTRTVVIGLGLVFLSILLMMMFGESSEKRRKKVNC